MFFFLVSALRLSSCALSDEDIHKTFPLRTAEQSKQQEGISERLQLRQVDLSSNDLSDDGLSAFCGAIQQFSLQALIISDNRNLGDAGFDVLAKTVLAKQSLKTLELAGVGNFTVGGLASIANHCWLQKLVLADNTSLGSEAGPLYADLLSSPVLIYLDVRGTRLGKVTQQTQPKLLEAIKARLSIAASSATAKNANLSLHLDLAENRLGPESGCAIASIFPSALPPACASTMGLVRLNLSSNLLDYRVPLAFARVMRAWGAPSQGECSRRKRPRRETQTGQAPFALELDLCNNPLGDSSVPTSSGVTSALHELRSVPFWTIHSTPNQHAGSSCHHPC